MATHTKENMTLDAQRSKRIRPIVVVSTFLLVLGVIQTWSSAEVTQTGGILTSSDRAKVRTRSYIPSSMERFFLKNLSQLGFDQKHPLPETCRFWKDPSASPIYDDLTTYRKELRAYQERLQAFPGTVKDLRKHLDEGICDTLELHPQGMPGMFSGGFLTQSNGNWMEPLLPPMRSPEFCFDRSKLMSLDYVVHDFASHCRKLKPTSRTVFVDLGASLSFHKNWGQDAQPAVNMARLYQKFGFHWDHYYAYELKTQDPYLVARAIPEEFFGAFHWINVGVEASNSTKTNPLNMLLQNYDEDDFIVVKLDIDFAAIEVPLAKQLLFSEPLSRLVDVFYFEHHVHFLELAGYWTSSMHGTLAKSLKLFATLRKNGIAAHSWV